jgi:hypothetical protein
MKTKFDMDGTGVKIDMPALEKVLKIGVGLAYRAVHKRLEEVNEYVSQAELRRFNGDSDGNFHNLCYANTNRAWLVESVEHYSAAIEALFHISEANKRGVKELVDCPEPMK